MSGIMKGGAVVEPKAVAKMKKDTDVLAANLKKTAKDLIQKTENLNAKGFQDGNFGQLNAVIMNNKQNLDKLEKVMDSFSAHLVNVEKNINDLVGGTTMPIGKTNVQ